ncbi:MULTISPECIES: VRR-NUC domain-containing protein [Arthrobacter]|uniref:VRR-NUC domain-containing protein n=1 Tax=Arthrobacter terricola TaxID=2547396 RepID=A0A4R5KAX5_9MICC|nr:MULTISPECIES: VRR-NUC domain-containing protein [Arthrobacter]MBT8162922.1 VRR-NUC domain-containing protein [Arthrobacter sp. GN70]TDF91665.1 VRR-NUC domain-containing protein [Arthrobacter terricola]
MARILENPVEHYLLAQCRKNGFLCLKFVSPARGGVPDRIIVTGGEHGTVFVEAKRPGEQPTRRQQATHAKMRRFGAEIHVVDSYTAVEQLMNHLSGPGALPFRRPA